MAEEKTTEVDWEKKYNDLVAEHDEVLMKVIYSLHDLEKRIK